MNVHIEEVAHTQAEEDSLVIATQCLLRSAVRQLHEGLQEESEGRPGAVARIDRGYELAKLALATLDARCLNDE